jgi:hypothetical protein
MKLNGLGQLNLPSQPGFAAFSDASFTAFDGNIVVFNQVQYNQGGHYNVLNGRFTTPVAGDYSISYSVAGGGTVNQSIDFAIFINGVSYCRSRAYPQTNSNNTYLRSDSFPALRLVAGDIVDVRVLGVDASGLAIFTADKRNRFSMRLEG